VNCSNCGAKFAAYYGYDEENVERVNVQKCGLCRGDEFKRDNFKGATIRLVVEVTSRR
jgi:hypothetical protein